MDACNVMRVLYKIPSAGCIVFYSLGQSETHIAQSLKFVRQQNFVQIKFRFRSWKSWLGSSGGFFFPRKKNLSLTQRCSIAATSLVTSSSSSLTQRCSNYHWSQVPLPLPVCHPITGQVVHPNAARAWSTLLQFLGTKLNDHEMKLPLIKFFSSYI
jgi:hypothetical protein